MFDEMHLVIKQSLEDWGIKQEAFAAMNNWPATYVSDVLCGRKGLTQNFFRKLPPVVIRDVLYWMAPFLGCVVVQMKPERFEAAKRLRHYYRRHLNT
jgi:hypothetical protein